MSHKSGKKKRKSDNKFYQYFSKPFVTNAWASLHPLIKEYSVGCGRTHYHLHVTTLASHQALHLMTHYYCSTHTRLSSIIHCIHLINITVNYPYINLKNITKHPNYKELYPCLPNHSLVHLTRKLKPWCSCVLFKGKSNSNDCVLTTSAKHSSTIVVYTKHENGTSLSDFTVDSNIESF